MLNLVLLTVVKFLQFSLQLSIVTVFHSRVSVFPVLLVNLTTFIFSAHRHNYSGRLRRTSRHLRSSRPTAN